MFEIKAKVDRGCLVLTCTGVMASVRQEELVEKMTAGYEEACKTIVLDLEDIPYVDSAAIGALVELRAIAARRGGEVAFVGLQKSVRSIFAIVRFDKLFRFFPTLERALEEMGTSEA